MTDREAWAAAIAAVPWDDELTRPVYADWLDDQGEHDEAVRQRAYPAALKLLASFTSPRIQKVVAADPVGGQEALRILFRSWVEEARKGTRYGHEKDWPDFWGGNRLTTEEQEDEFWRAMEVIIGLPFEDSRGWVIGYRPCAC